MGVEAINNISAATLDACVSCIRPPAVWISCSARGKAASRFCRSTACWERCQNAIKLNLSLRHICRELCCAATRWWSLPVGTQATLPQAPWFCQFRTPLCHSTYLSPTATNPALTLLGHEVVAHRLGALGLSRGTRSTQSSVQARQRSALFAQASRRGAARRPGGQRARPRATGARDAGHGSPRRQPGAGGGTGHVSRSLDAAGP